MFDEQPDGDPHGECADEIHRLEAENEKFRAAFRDLLSVRDQFAKAAMQGMWASDMPGYECSGKPEALLDRAKTAYAMADAMMAVRGTVPHGVPASQPDAWVPIHPRNGPLWSMTTDKPNAERLPGSYPLRALVFAHGATVDQTYYCPECGVMEGNWHLQSCSRSAETSNPRSLVRRPDGVDLGEGGKTK